jgi:hypothetical protein
MNLEKAIEILKDNDNVNDILENCGCKVMSAIDTVLNELEKQKQIKAEMRKVAYEEGYNQGYLAGAMERI